MDLLSASLSCILSLMFGFLLAMAIFSPNVIATPEPTDVDSDKKWLVRHMAVLNLGIDGDTEMRNHANESWRCLPDHLVAEIEKAEEELKLELLEQEEEAA